MARTDFGIVYNFLALVYDFFCFSLLVVVMDHVAGTVVRVVLASLV
jgi:hypothetical protein